MGSSNSKPIKKASSPKESSPSSPRPVDQVDGASVSKPVLEQNTSPTKIEEKPLVSQVPEEHLVAKASETAPEVQTKPETSSILEQKEETPVAKAPETTPEVQTKPKTLSIPEQEEETPVFKAPETETEVQTKLETLSIPEQEEELSVAKAPETEPEVQTKPETLSIPEQEEETPIVKAPENEIETLSIPEQQEEPAVTKGSKTAPEELEILSTPEVKEPECCEMLTPEINEEILIKIPENSPEDFLPETLAEPLMAGDQEEVDKKGSVPEESLTEKVLELFEETGHGEGLAEPMPEIDPEIVAGPAEKVEEQMPEPEMMANGDNDEEEETLPEPPKMEEEPPVMNGKYHDHDNGLDENFNFATKTVNEISDEALKRVNLMNLMKKFLMSNFSVEEESRADYMVEKFLQDWDLKTESMETRIGDLCEQLGLSKEDETCLEFKQMLESHLGEINMAA